MISFVAKKIFGTKNARVIKGMRPIVERINQLEPTMQAKSDADLREMTAEFRRRLGRGGDAGRSPPRGVRGLPRGGQAGAGDAALRRAAHRRHGAPPRLHRRDEDRRGEDAGRHAAGLPERAGRQGRPRHHGQRLPGPPRLGVDGAHLQVPRHDRGDRRPRPLRRRAPAELPVGRRLRDQLRVRVRLPARQHQGFDRALRPARAQLRHRRRGGLDPDRRGAHAAHHLGSCRAVRGAVHARSTASSPGCARTSTTPSTRRRTRRS